MCPTGVLFGNANSCPLGKAPELVFLTWYKHHVTNTEETQCFLSEEFEAERRNTNVNEERNTAKTTGEDAWRNEGVWNAASLGVPNIQGDLSQ